MKQRIFYSGILGVLLFVTAVILGGLQFESNSHVQHYISESYATGTPYGPQLRYGLYIPAGICIALFAFLSPTVLPRSPLMKWSFYGIGIFYGLATVVVSLFPCDAGCNPELINPSISQMIHNAMGALTYLIVPPCMVAIGIKATKWTHGTRLYKVSLFCGMTAFCLMLVLAQNPFGTYVGLQQRIIEGSILFWIVYTAIYIKKL
ncbi:DUF998 domain-containing protein [Arenibacter sp. GZD96]|uniref:DUF998 domain-containing protein n=1 Tax=Aurantibrevibacter litoralis TaxID=3106030 RepID=UPI002AFF70F6|nr:DUF998 domain-containing protein [Arenibacter sp. GZD-96]MEA1784471.1 DUF998 domain-containing protein [Arenibacter sp. GZD-96]